MLRGEQLQFLASALLLPIALDTLSVINEAFNGDEFVAEIDKSNDSLESLIETLEAAENKADKSASNISDAFSRIGKGITSFDFKEVLKGINNLVPSAVVEVVPEKRVGTILIGPAEIPTMAMSVFPSHCRTLPFLNLLSLLL